MEALSRRWPVRFPEEALVIRTLANLDEWAYWELEDFHGGRMMRRFLFTEPLTAKDRKNLHRMLKIEPLTVAARDAIDIARSEVGYEPINWQEWHLANPRLAKGGGQ